MAWPAPFVGGFRCLGATAIVCAADKVARGAEEWGSGGGKTASGDGQKGKGGGVGGPPGCKAWCETVARMGRGWARAGVDGDGTEGKV